MKSLGFGIIGCGTIATWHAQAIATIENAHLVGTYSRSAAHTDAFCKTHHARAFSSVEDLLLCSDIDVVCICTPSGLHASLAIAAAQHGKHVIVEKPMALTVADADAVIAACEQNGVKLAVICQIRFGEGMTKLKEAVDGGALGKLVLGDVVMKYYRNADYYRASDWRGTYAMDGGGALMNQGIHGIDALLYVMGEVKSVFAYAKTLLHDIEVEDTASAVVEFENGALGTIVGTTSVLPGYPRVLTVSGERGTIALEEDSILKWNVEGVCALSCGHAAQSGASDPTAIGLSGHITQIGDMVSAILEDREPLVNGREGRRAVKLITAIYASQKSGKPILLSEFNG